MTAIRKWQPPLPWLSGQADNTNTNLLAVSSADNSTTATGVGIEILDNTSSPLKPDGATFSAKQALVEGTNTLRFTARYKATAAATTPVRLMPTPPLS